MADPPLVKPPSRIAGVLRGVAARRGVLASLALLAGGGLVVDAVWRSAEPSLRNLPQYRVTASTIELTPPPAWVRADVKLEALRDAGLLGGPDAAPLSVLDDAGELERRVATAIGFHPWVESVGIVRRLPPNRLVVEASYRTPVAALRLRGGGSTTGQVVDRAAVVLPPGDLTPATVARLPRIECRAPLTPVRPGEAWTDPRVTGAVAMITSLGDAWPALRLVDVTPSRTPEVRRDRPYFLYELRSTGNTRIAWGAAPGHAPADEPPFAEKLARLRSYVERHGPLDSVATSPAWIDVRRGLTTRPRVVKKRPPTQTAAKPDDGAEVR